MEFTGKIAFVGDSGVGKTQFINRHLTGKFSPTHIPTLGCKIDEIAFSTSIGKVELEILEFGGDPKFGGISDKLSEADGVVVMFDGCHTFASVPKWLDEIDQHLGLDAVPIVLCFNKVDRHQNWEELRQLLPRIQEANFGGFYPISAKSNYNFEKPFTNLMSRLINLNVQIVPS